MLIRKLIRSEIFPAHVDLFNNDICGTNISLIFIMTINLLTTQDRTASCNSEYEEFCPHGSHIAPISACRPSVGICYPMNGKDVFIL